MIHEIVTIDWFANAGRSIPDEIGDFVAVKSWMDACEKCGDDWADVVTEARNDFTIHLNRECKAEFQKWNNVITSIKQDLSETWRRMRDKVTELGLPRVVADCVEWDTMHAIAEERFREWHPPIFFGRLLKVYEVGHFPCGWNGEWPNGRLIVY